MDDGNVRRRETGKVLIGIGAKHGNTRTGPLIETLRQCGG